MVSCPRSPFFAGKDGPVIFGRRVTHPFGSRLCNSTYLWVTVTHPFGSGVRSPLICGCPTPVARFWRRGGHNLHSGRYSHPFPLLPSPLRHMTGDPGKGEQTTNSPQNQIWVPRSSLLLARAGPSYTPRCGRCNPHPRHRSRALPFSPGPWRLTLHHSLFPSRVIPKAAPPPILGLFSQPRFHRMAVDVAQLLLALLRRRGLAL